uniref:Uncharacterized protein n=1 Tax=Percolomonas cosmopolitus TaxID=63605 RepID=A0A7S1PGM7_9EUKA
MQKTQENTLTLQQLMDDDDFIHETKVQNEKLFYFLIQEHILLQIVNFIIQVPQLPDENDSRNEQFVKRIHKYPQLAFQVFQNYPEIYAHIASSPRLLNALFSFLSSSIPETNPRLYAFWIKIMIRLLEQQPEPVFQFIMTRENDFILQQILSHITMDKMVDFMLKLFMCDNFDWEQEQNVFQTPLRKFMLKSKTNSTLAQRKKRDESAQQAAGKASQNKRNSSIGTNQSPLPQPLTLNRIGEFWLEQNVLERCLALMRPEYDIEIHTTVQFLLTCILKRSIQFVQPSKQLSKLNALARKLISSDFVDTYIRNLLNYESSTVMSCGVDLLACLVSICTSNPVGVPMLAAATVSGDVGVGGQQKSISPTTETPQKTSRQDSSTLWPVALRQCVLDITNQLPSFVRILQHPSEIIPSSVTTTFGVLSPPLGETRLKVIDFLSTLFLSPLSEISVQLVKCNVLGVITDLFFSYEFNSLLHNQFLKIISYILSRDHLDLKRALFQECKIVERILAAHRLNEEACSKPRGVRKGYMGHLIIISNTIVTTAKSQREIQDMIHDSSEEWQVFVENDLAERNLIQTTTLGGTHPMSSNSDMEDHFKEFDDEIDEDDFHSSSGGIQAPMFSSDKSQIIGATIIEEDEEDEGEDDTYDSDDSDSDSSDEDDTIIRRRDEHRTKNIVAGEKLGCEGAEKVGSIESAGDEKSEGIYTDLHFWSTSMDLNAFDIEI